MTTRILSTCSSSLKYISMFLDYNNAFQASVIHCEYEYIRKVNLGLNDKKKIIFMNKLPLSRKKEGG